MKTKRSFLLSIFLHAGIITGAVALSTLLKEEKEEEIILELSLSEPSPSSEVQPVVKQTVSQPQKNQPAQSDITTAITPEPIVETQKTELKVQKEVLVPSQPVTVAQVTQNEPQVVPTIKPLQMVAPVDAEEQYLENHLSTIRDILVKYRKYPSQAARLKQEGALKVTFRLKQNGEVEDIRVVSSSGYEILDEDALALIQKSAEYFPKPPKSVRITVPLNYTLKIRA